VSRGKCAIVLTFVAGLIRRERLANVVAAHDGSLPTESGETTINGAARRAVRIVMIRVEQASAREQRRIA